LSIVFVFIVFLPQDKKNNKRYCRQCNSIMLGLLGVATGPSRCCYWPSNPTCLHNGGTV